MRIIFILLTLLSISCSTTTYYITRHAEKADNTTDPPLSANGLLQAQNLKNYLAHKNIQAIYSTNFKRTRGTAKPLSDATGASITLYSPMQQSQLVDSLKGITKNVLIVGHSNTVDDIVDRFMGVETMSDLSDLEYGDLFIVKKKGDRFRFQKIKVPEASSQ